MNTIHGRLREAERDCFNLNSQVHEANKKIESLRQQLAKCQATNGKLREAASIVVDTHDEILPIMNAYMKTLGVTSQWEKTCIASDKLREALALPNDATALNELIAERTKTQKEYYESVLQDGANRIAELTVEVERLSEDVSHWRHQSDEAGMLRVRYGAKIDELTAQRDEAMVDAERYQHLRENHFIWTTPVFLKDSDKVKSYVAIEFHWHTSKDKKPTKTSLDEAIDAAIANCK